MKRKNVGSERSSSFSLYTGTDRCCPGFSDIIIVELARQNVTLLNEEILLSDPILASMVNRLAEEFHPERIYLFGSKARGDSGPDSDYDLLMLVTHTEEPRYRIAQRALDLFWESGIAVDILVWTLESFEAKADVAASLPATVIREGKLLYAA